MARVPAPSSVVLEDCDLIAEDRSFSYGPQPLLFEVLDAMDGLDKDADAAFVLTTNRVDMLERAQAAVTCPRPYYSCAQLAAHPCSHRRHPRTLNA